MATKFYILSVAPTVAPSAGEKNATLPYAQHVNHTDHAIEKSLSTTFSGTATSLNTNTFANTNPQSHYFGRFSSPPLAAQSIPSQTWNMYVAAGMSSSAANQGSFHTLYIYRPSDGNIQWIFDGSYMQSGKVWFTSGNPITTENRLTGAAVTTQDGDILVYEFWGAGSQTSSMGPYVCSANINRNDCSIECTVSTLTFYTPPAGPVGTVNVTEESDTVAATGTVVTPTLGTANVTEGVDTVAATGTVVNPPGIAGTVAKTEAADVLTSTGTVVSPTSSGTLSKTEAADVLASTGTVVNPVGIAGTANITEGSDGLSAEGTVGAGPVSGTFDKTEGADTVTSTGTVVNPPGISGTVAKTEGADVLASTGTVVNPAGIAGSLANTEGVDTLSADGTVVNPVAIAGTADITEGEDTLTASGTIVTPTLLYFSNAAPAYAPTTGDKSTYMPQGLNRVGNIGEASLTKTAPPGPGTINSILIPIEFTGTVSGYFGRYSSQPLAAQTIPAQDWTYAAKVQCGTATNMKHVPVIYIWRPSTNTVVQHISDASTGQGTTWPTSAVQSTHKFAGASVTVQEGDILVIEAWGLGNHTSTSGGGASWYHGDPLSYVASPYPIVFSGASAGTANITEQDDILAASGTVISPVAGTVDTTEQDDILASTGTVVDPAAVGGTANITEGADSISSTGTVVNPAAVAGTANITEAADTLSSSGTVVAPTAINGSIGVTEAADVLSSTGTVVNPPGVAGTANITEGGDTVAATGVVSYQPFSTLTEDFEAALDTNKWVTNNNNGTVTFSGGTGNFTTTGTASTTQARMDSKDFFALRDSFAFAKVVQPPRYAGDPGSNEFTPVGLESAGTNRLTWAVDSNGMLRVVKFTNGVWAQLKLETSAYFANTATYTWFRIREAAGTTYWDTAPSTASDPPQEAQWVNRYSAATSTLPLNMGAAKFAAWSYIGNAAAGLPTQIGMIDALNIGTGAAPPRRRWFLTN